MCSDDLVLPRVGWRSDDPADIGLSTGIAENDYKESSGQRDDESYYDQWRRGVSDDLNTLYFE